jgi:hypothetical protein
LSSGLPLADYSELTTKRVNRKVNLDHALFVAQVKRSIYGKCVFEIILEYANGAPSWLLSLQSTSDPGTKLEPELSENWELTGFKYSGEHKYDPQEVLYFVNLELENDHLGLSDIEPIASTCKARIREFGTPRFLINKTPENRATAYVEFEAFISGPTANTPAIFQAGT